MTIDLFVITAGAALAAGMSWGYFRRFAIARPPIGVFNLRDVAMLLVAIAAIPYVYLQLPAAALAAVLMVTVTSILYFTLDPVLGRRLALGVAATVIGTDVALALADGTTSEAFLALNNVLMIVAVAGVANLWVQSGMGAREVTVLAAGLTVYDYVATSQLTLMTDLIGRVSEVPLVPFLAWNTAHGAGLGIGLGDLLLVSAFPLAMRKSFGRAAGLAGLAIGLAVVVIVLALLETGTMDTAIPVMVPLGPLMVAQYAFWARRLPLRTTWQYLLAEPLARA